MPSPEAPKNPEQNEENKDNQNADNFDVRKETQDNLENIKEYINPNPATFDIIKENREDNWMYFQLKKTFESNDIYPELNWNPEAKIDKFATEINKVVTNYLKTSLNIDPTDGKFDWALKSMSTWIQFVLMDTMANPDNKGTEQASTENADFFSSFQKVDLTKFKSTFTWLLWSFGKSTKFLEAGKKITKAIDFISLNLNSVNANTIPELMNPYKFYKLINDPVLQNAEDITKLKLSDLWIQQWDIIMTDEERKKLIEISKKCSGYNDPKTIKWIISSLDKANKFLEKRGDLKNNVLDLFEKTDSIFQPFEKLLWKDIFKSLKKMKVLNLLLSMLGFSGWFEWLQRQLIDRKIWKNWKQFCNDVLDEYKNSQDTNEDTYDRYKDKIWTLDDKYKAKIPTKFEWLKTALNTKLTPDIIISSTILKSLNIKIDDFANKKEVEVDKKWKKTKEIQYTIKEEKKSEFIKAYLDYIIPHIAKNVDFMDDDNINQDSFVLAVWWWLIAWEDMAINGVKLWIIKSEHIEKNNNLNNQEQFNQNDKLWKLNFEQAKTLAENVFGNWSATQLLIKFSKDNPAMIIRTITLAKHEWWLKFGIKNRDPSWTQYNKWTFQISDKINVEKKYNECLIAGKNLAKDKWIDVLSPETLSLAQQDLLSWLWYINKYRWWEDTLNKLWDPNLSDKEIETLMSNTIQWWIAAIWKSVVDQIHNETISSYA